MQIILAKHNGFCMGVKHAVDTAMSLESDNAFVLGEIIHNPDVVRAIENKGLKTVNSLKELPDGCTVIFRSHGVPESYYGECAARNITIIDCTCGFVRRTQKIVKEQYSLKKDIVIIGERNHPEVIGLLGWCENNATVISGFEDVNEDLAQKNLCVVCQTTFSEQKFEKIIKNIISICEKTFAVFKTI